MIAAFDTETWLIDGPCPPLVCGSYADDAEGPSVHDRDVAVRTFENLVAGRDTVAGANIAFDVGVVLADRPDLVEAVFDKYDRGEVHDVQIAQALDAIAGGHLGKEPDGRPLLDARGRHTTRYSLDTCVRQVLGRTDAKARDFWRKRYAFLADVPLPDWPEPAREYPKDDARNTRDVALGQADHRNRGDMPRQARAALALRLGAAWGLRTDGAAVAALKAEAQALRYAARERFAAFMKDGKHDSKTVKTLVARLYGASGVCPACGGSGFLVSPKTKRAVGCSPRNVEAVELAGGAFCDGTGLDLSTAPGLPRTDAGGVSETRDTLMESGDDDLAAYGEGTEDKVLDTYVPFLESGAERPIFLSPNVLLESGRCSYDGVIQLLPRQGAVRECFSARPGYLYLSTDYPSLELCTLAQTCKWVVGWSRMLDVINGSADPGALHLVTAAQILGRSFAETKAAYERGDEDVALARQAAKPVNYMLPGGGGAAKFVLINRKPETGRTKAPDGRTYPGLRFCVLVGGARSCGVEKVFEWKRRPCPPTCLACLRVVEDVLKPAFFSAYPEVREYHSWVATKADAGEAFPCFDPTSPEGVSRWRGGCGFTDGANNGFQAPAADVAKDAFWEIARECYVGKKRDGSPSPLAGTRPVVLLHDEVFSETPEAEATAAALRQAELMSDSLERHCPDMVRIKVEPALMRRWYKKAEAVWSDGRLLPWEPK